MKQTKILVIRFSSIGDIVLTTPIIRALKTCVKNVELHFLTKTENETLLRNNIYIDKLHLLSTDFSKTTESLCKEEFDYVVDLHKNFRSLRIKRALGVRASSFPKLNFRKWLLVNCKFNMMPSVHIVDRYFEAVRDLEAVNDGRGLDYFLQESDIVESESLPENFKSGYVACVVGSKHETKQMPIDLMVDLCNRINKPIILLGGKGDRDKASIIEHKVGTKVFNACGAYNINQSAYLLKHSLGIVTPDTGLMHIASAFDKNIVAVWGNTVPQLGMYPYRAKNAEGKTYNFEVKNLKCRPCSKLGYDKCPKGHFECMQQQDVAKIAEIVNSWSED